jgi:hypothetical protein
MYRSATGITRLNMKRSGKASGERRIKSDSMVKEGALSSPLSVL